MKKCPECGEGFIGFERVCGLCRRNPPTTKTADAEPASKSGLVAEEPLTDICLACGQKIRPKPLTQAEKQQRYRDRKND